MKLSATMLSTLVVTAVLSTPVMAQKQTWTMTSTWPSSLELMQIDKHWVDLANQLTGDELKIDFFEGGSLVPSGEAFAAVESGTIQAAGDWPGYWAGRDPAFSPLGTHTSLFNAVDYINWIKEWGGDALFNEVYGKYGMVYLPYGVTNNESGFRTLQPIRNLEDLKGKRLRLSGLEQGKVLERLGGNQVSMAGQELYQALERGVIDGAEFSTPNVDVSAGLHQVTKYWATPGWHQSSSMFGVMINKEAWDKLSPETQAKLKIAADANLLWSMSFTEKRAIDGYQTFADAGIEINRMDDESLATIQNISNEVMVEVACSGPLAAKVYTSQVQYLADYKGWRDASAPFNLGRSPDGPDLDKLKACLK
ncbi:TRAP transporter substrate-binding protein DctP [Castellaniella sp.]|uniref:TRAP transporter substrate-binding protein DctP n=1 Tax=Castellaniella sp. TaxID=1955812 RepID=UPI003569C220